MASLLIGLAIKSHKVLSKIPGGIMKKKEKELEKVIQQYKKRLRPLFDKFREAKTLEELKKARDEKYAVYDEIRKKYKGEDWQKITWGLSVLARNLANEYESQRAIITGKRRWSF